MSQNMTNREAGYALKRDARATELELHIANLLIGGGETDKAQDELIIAQWREERLAAPAAEERRAA